MKPIAGDLETFLSTLSEQERHEVEIANKNWCKWIDDNIKEWFDRASDAKQKYDEDEEGGYVTFNSTNKQNALINF